MSGGKEEFKELISQGIRTLFVNNEITKNDDKKNGTEIVKQMVE